MASTQHFSTIVMRAFTPTTLSSFRARQKVGALHVLETYLVGGFSCLLLYIESCKHDVNKYDDDDDACV